jgi:hypothetical protein
MQRPSLIALGLVLILVMSVGAWRVQAQDAEPDDVAPPTSLNDVMIPQSLTGSAFTYQGRLTSGGAPVNGTCDFQFSLFDAASAGTQIGSTQPATNVSVMNGLFTVAIDFGGGAFNGLARWLEIGVRCPAGSGSYTTLSPRQTLTAAPYAQALPGLWTQQNAVSPNLIGGFSGNSVTSGVVGATIGGGGLSDNANRVTDNYGTVGGGRNNQAGNNAGTVNDGAHATVGGGLFNTASGTRATVGGGWGNTASEGDATVGGGQSNTANGQGATVGGGLLNTASGTHATVGGGQSNTASGTRATVGGGWGNTASGQFATVGGGWGNTASGQFATVGGGENNTAAGNYSFAAGRRARNVNAAHTGVFLFADSTNADFNSIAANEFAARANGGFRFVSSSGTCTTTGGSWSCTSDRNAKMNFAAVDGREVLSKVAGLSILTWSFKDNAAIRHMGPTAQDFYAAFGLGHDDTTISTIDLDGVALAAIQGLYGLVQEKDAEIAALRAANTTMEAEIAALKAENAKLNDRLAAIEQALQANGTPVRVAASPAVLPQGGIALLGMLGGLVIGGAIVYRRRAGGGR